MQFSIIIQARLGSTRLSGKILKNYKSYNLLNVLIKRLKRSKKIQKYHCSYNNTKRRR